MIISNNVAHKLFAIALFVMTTNGLTLNGMEPDFDDQDDEMGHDVICINNEINNIAEMAKDPSKNTFTFVKKIKVWCAAFGPKLSSEHLDEALTRAGVPLLAIKDEENWSALHWAVYMLDVKLAQCFLSVADDEAWDLICMKTTLDKNVFYYAHDNDEMKNLLLSYKPK